MGCKPRHRAAEAPRTTSRTTTEPTADRAADEVADEAVDEAADEAADEVADRADLLVGALCDLTEVAHGLRTLHVPGAPHNYITVFCGSSLAIIRPEAVSLDRSCPLCGVRAVSSSSYRINIQ